MIKKSIIGVVLCILMSNHSLSEEKKLVTNLPVEGWSLRFMQPEVNEDILEELKSLSDSAKSTVFVHLFHLTLAPLKPVPPDPFANRISHGFSPVGKRLEEETKEQQSLDATRELREGILVGWYSSLFYFDVEQATALLLRDSRYYQKNNYRKPDLDHLHSVPILHRPSGSNSEIEIIQEYYPRSLTTFNIGFSKGHRLADHLILEARRNLEDWLSRNFETEVQKVKDGEELSEKEKRIRLSEFPSFEALLFLRKAFDWKIKEDTEVLNSALPALLWPCACPEVLDGLENPGIEAQNGKN